MLSVYEMWSRDYVAVNYRVGGDLRKGNNYWSLPGIELGTSCTRPSALRMSYRVATCTRLIYNN